MPPRLWSLSADDTIPPVFKLKEILRRHSILPTDEVLLRAPVFLMEGALPELPEVVKPGEFRLPYGETALQLLYGNDRGQTRLFVLACREGLNEHDQVVLQVSGYCNDPEQPGAIVPVPVMADWEEARLGWEVMPLPSIADPAADLPPGWTEEQCGDEAAMLLGMALRCLLAIRQAGGAGRLSRRAIPASRRSLTKKIPAQGWEYRLVKLPGAAPAPAGGPLAKGTHASPRWHTRRGHERHLASGKVVWVRDCVVGDPARGGIVHDYQVT